MRRLVHRATLPLTPHALWNLLTEVENYPTYAPFISNIQVSPPLQKGSVYFDSTTILWVPLKIKHVVTRFEPHKALSYDVFLPGGGRMTQHYVLFGKGTITEIEATISFHLHNPIVHFFVGPVLQKRLATLLATTIKNIHDKASGGS